VAERLRKVSPF